MPDKVNILDLIGKPFLMGAKGPTAFDCYNLCREVCKRGRLHLPDKESFVDNAIRHAAIVDGKESEYIRLEKPEPLCLVTISLRPPFITHLGVVLDGVRFIHIMEKRHVAVERLDNPIWQKRIEGYYRYVGPATRKS